MVPRPKKDTLESLRVTLQQLEQTADPARLSFTTYTDDVVAAVERLVAELKEA